MNEMVKKYRLYLYVIIGLLVCGCAVWLFTDNIHDNTNTIRDIRQNVRHSREEQQRITREIESARQRVEESARTTREIESINQQLETINNESTDAIKRIETTSSDSRRILEDNRKQIEVGRRILDEIRKTKQE